MLVQQFKPRPSGPLRYGVEQLGPAGAVLPRDPQLLQTKVPRGKASNLQKNFALLR